MYAKFLLCDEDVFKVSLSGNLAVLQKCTQVWKGGYRKILTEEIKSKNLYIAREQGRRFG